MGSSQPTLELTALLSSSCSRRLSLGVLVAVALALSACGVIDAGPQPAEDAGVRVAPSGLPEGESTWRGSLMVNGLSIATELVLTNAGGDLTGLMTVSDDPEAPIGLGRGEYTVSGTYEPTSQRIAIAPNAWSEEPSAVIELWGFLGAYEPEGGTIAGTVADYASGDDNTLMGGPGQLLFVSGDGAPTAAGAGTNSLPVGSRPFNGRYQCGGPEREVTGDLSFDGGGAISGTVTYGLPTLADGSNRFVFTGVHNPTTGRVTLVPGLYTASVTSLLTMFVEAAYDPTDDAIRGGGRTNMGPCAVQGWDVGF